MRLYLRIRIWLFWVSYIWGARGRVAWQNPRQRILTLVASIPRSRIKRNVKRTSRTAGRIPIFRRLQIAVLFKIYVWQERFGYILSDIRKKIRLMYWRTRIFVLLKRYLWQQRYHAHLRPVVTSWYPRQVANLKKIRDASVQVAKSLLHNVRENSTRIARRVAGMRPRMKIPRMRLPRRPRFPQLRLSLPSSPRWARAWNWTQGHSKDAWARIKQSPKWTTAWTWTKGRLPLAASAVVAIVLAWFISGYVLQSSVNIDWATVGMWVAIVTVAGAILLVIALNQRARGYAGATMASGWVWKPIATLLVIGALGWGGYRIYKRATGPTILEIGADWSDSVRVPIGYGLRWTPEPRDAAFEVQSSSGERIFFPVVDEYKQLRHGNSVRFRSFETRPVKIEMKFVELP